MYIKNNIFEVEALPHGSLTPGGKANGGGRKGGKAKGVGATVTLQCSFSSSVKTKIIRKTYWRNFRMFGIYQISFSRTDPKYEFIFCSLLYTM